MDERLQLPIYFSELGDDAQTDLIDELLKKYGRILTAENVRKALLELERNGECVGHIVVYEDEVFQNLNNQVLKMLKNL